MKDAFIARSIYSGLLCFCTALFCLGPPAGAHEAAEGKVHAAIGPYFYRTEIHDHIYDEPWLGGAGLIAEGDIDYHGGLEFSLMYTRRHFAMERAGGAVIERDKRVDIGTGYRHWFNPKFSAGASFVSSYLMGDPEYVRNDFPPGAAPKTSANDPVEYGFDFSVQYEPWRSGRWSCVIDARYSLSVTQKFGEDSNIYGALVMVKYFVQGHEPEPEP